MAAKKLLSPNAYIQAVWQKKCWNKIGHRFVAK